MRSRDGHKLRITECKDCGKEIRTRADRKHSGYCRVCKVKGDRNAMAGKTPHNKGKITYVRNEEARRRKRKLVLLKGNKCAVCGLENLPIECYDFHHLEKKEIQIGRFIHYKWDKILEEAKKCVMVCANCHRHIHQKGKSAYTP